MTEERKYTLEEIMAVRAAVEALEFFRCPDTPEAERAARVEAQLQTYLRMGISPPDLDKAAAAALTEYKKRQVKAAGYFS